MTVKLIILDIDNTVFDWMTYYIPAFKAQLQSVEKVTGIPYLELAKECQEVFTQNGSVEYPFVIQQLPLVNTYYKNDVERMLSECVEPSRQKFNDVAYSNLKSYKSVIPTLKSIKELHPDAKIVALTDAPRYIAMWKCGKLELLHYFDAIYGLQDPRLPIVNGVPAVTREILLKHLERKSFGFTGKIRILPDEYEKPGVKGMKSILIDYELDELEDKKQIIYVGDNLYKDTELGRRLGVTTIYAEYGTRYDTNLIDIFKDFSPSEFVRRGVRTHEPPKPDHTIQDFSEILNLI